MLAHVALDKSVGSGKFAFAGDRVWILDVITVIEEQLGRAFERRSLGTEARLRAAKAAAEKDLSNPFAPVMMAYELYMLTGQTSLDDLQNTRSNDASLNRHTNSVPETQSVLRTLCRRRNRYSDGDDHTQARKAD